MAAIAVAAAAVAADDGDRLREGGGKCHPSRHREGKERICAATIPRQRPQSVPRRKNGRQGIPGGGRRREEEEEATDGRLPD